MLLFRFFCLRDDGRVACGRTIDLPDPTAAIPYAYVACRAAPNGSFRHVEVWAEERLLYTSKRTGRGVTGH
jgi:hypothetical protein